jgi:hypothetical protein
VPVPARAAASTHRQVHLHFGVDAEVAAILAEVNRDGG